MTRKNKEKTCQTAFTSYFCLNEVGLRGSFPEQLLHLKYACGRGLLQKASQNSYSIYLGYNTCFQRPITHNANRKRLKCTTIKSKITRSEERLGTGMTLGFYNSRNIWKVPARSSLPHVAEEEIQFMSVFTEVI